MCDDAKADDSCQTDASEWGQVFAKRFDEPQAGQLVLVGHVAGESGITGIEIHKTRDATEEDNCVVEDKNWNNLFMTLW